MHADGLMGVPAETPASGAGSAAAIGPTGAPPGATAPDVSAQAADWQRETVAFLEWKPGVRLLRSIRAYQRWRGRWGLLGKFPRALCVLRYRFWSVVTGCDIPLNARIGGGLFMPHPNGIVIHSDTVIGPNCMLFQQVTIGITGMGGPAPVLGGHVDVGAGARILGGVTIGDHARIGANAVVLCDVPAGATAVGVPARVLGQK